MKDFNGITFVSAEGEEVLFHPSIRRSNPDRNKEYELFLQAACVLAEVITSGEGGLIIYGDVSPSNMERLFFGDNYHLVKEQDKVDGFPDFVLVKDNLIVIVDHFKVDASKALGTMESPHGTEYMRFRGNRLRNVKDDCFDLPILEKAIDEEGIGFSTGNLARNIVTHFADKVEKISGYKTCFHEHVRSGLNEEYVAEDLSKPIEVWLMIEDVSPCCGFQYVGKTIASLLAKSSSINGLIYISNPHPTIMFSSVEQIALIANDETAIQQLSSMGVSAD